VPTAACAFSTVLQRHEEYNLTSNRLIKLSTIYKNLSSSADSQTHVEDRINFPLPLCIAKNNTWTHFDLMGIATFNQSAT